MRANGPVAPRPKSTKAIRRLAGARSAKTFGTLIELHIGDMKDVGKPPQRSKSATLEMLQRKLGALSITQLDRERLIRFGRDRAKEGAGPVTLGMDLGAIKLVIGHAVTDVPFQDFDAALNELAHEGVEIIFFDFLAGPVKRGHERNERCAGISQGLQK